MKKRESSPVLNERTRRRGSARKPQPPGKGRLRLRQQTADEIGFRQRAADGDADDVLRIVVGKEPARAVARRVQARNRLALAVEHLHPRVDTQTVERAKHRARLTHTVEGRLPLIKLLK